MRLSSRKAVGGLPTPQTLTGNPEGAEGPAVRLSWTQLTHDNRLSVLAFKSSAVGPRQSRNRHPEAGRLTDLPHDTPLGRGVEEPVPNVAEGTPAALLLPMLLGAFQPPKPEGSACRRVLSPQLSRIFVACSWPLLLAGCALVSEDS
jgi:hypothetical protein